MKKNFFKKLSFVLALAMVLSAIAPVSGALAATAPKLTATSKVLYIGGNPSKYDFGITGLVKGSKVTWSTSNAAVATVDKATGLTVGKTKGTVTVSAKITPATGKATTLKASVQVRDFIQSATVVAPKTDKFVAGTLYDFNATVKTFSGATTVGASSSTLRYFVEDKDGKVVGADVATVDAGTGKITFLATGDYKVVLGAFNSKAVSGDVANAKRTFSADVKVVNAIKEVKQTTTSKFVVTFAADVSKSDLSKDTASVSKVLNGKVVSGGTEKIKSVAIDGNKATVELFVPFDTETTYNFAYGDLTGNFTSAKIDISEVKGLVFDSFNVYADAAHSSLGTNMLAKVHAVNANGVVILDGDNAALTGYLTFTYGGELTKGFISGYTAYVYEVGYVAPVSVEFKNYVYNEATGTFDSVSFTANATAAGVKYNDGMNVSTFQIAAVGVSSDTGVAPTADSAWSTNVTLAAKDEAVAIYTRYKAYDPTQSSGLATSYTAGTGYTYVSSDTDKLIITGSKMQAVAAGTVTVLVKDTVTNTLVTTFDVVIKAERKFGTLQLSANSVNIGNDPLYGEDGTIKVTTKDTVGDAFVPTVTVDSLVNAPTGVTLLNSGVMITPGTAGSDSVLPITINAKGAVAGAYNYKLTVTYPISINHPVAESKDVNVTVIVIAANAENAAASTVTRWALELGTNSVDFKNVVTATDGDVSINVYGYNAAGKRVDKLNTADFDLTIKKGTDAATAAPSKTELNVITSTSGVLSSAYDNATYVLTATVTGGAISGYANGSFLGAQTLLVQDTTAKAVTTDKLVVDAAAIDVAVKDAFNFTLNGASLDDNAKATIISVSAKLGDGTNPSAISVGQSVFISSVQWKVEDPNNAGIFKVYTIDVNRTITGK